ncbi:Sjogren's syndrome/scleroderma autoantigen 1 family protein [Halocatena halophila]|uniref:Sjogren's syndrome/scleroderma autoantigen 1 family protein n=1 Tax=Halocatena halophila TaxID=2814576 RepID=UPI002ED4C329
MSEFDEQAEREKLKRQFERDQKKREATARMSELLLQGATMTDTHCDTCGDPLFRHDGTEFCPTCHTEDSTDAHAQEADASNAESSTSTPATDSAETTATEPAGSGDDSQPSPTESTTTPSAARDTDATDRSPEPSRTPRSESATPQHPRESPPAGASSLEEARTALERTITRFATQADTIEDPDRARSYLLAVEDAASALRALDRTSSP